VHARSRQRGGVFENLFEGFVEVSIESNKRGAASVTRVGIPKIFGSFQLYTVYNLG
jgi:hypothetical protein